MILSFNEVKGWTPTTAPIMGGAGTTTVTWITSNWWSLNGTYTWDWGSPVTWTGFVFYPTGNASTAIGWLNVVQLIDWTLSSPITATATWLIPSTTYCFKPYAINAIGTSYWVELCFTTSAPSIPTVTIDTVTMGSYCCTATGTATNFAWYTITWRGIVSWPTPNPVIGWANVQQNASWTWAWAFTVTNWDLSPLSYPLITSAAPLFSTVYTSAYVTYTWPTSWTSYSYDIWNPDISWSFTANMLNTGLVSYYKSDTSWSYLDSIGTNHWTINWATFNPTWKLNGGYLFNWVNNYIGKNITFALFEPMYSISFWIKVTTPNNWSIIVDIAWPSISQYLKAIRCRWLNIDILNSNNSLWVTASSVVAWQWHHICDTRDNTFGHKVYNNWVLISTNTVTSPWTSWLSIDIWIWWAANPSNWFFNWELDEIAFYTKTLNDCEVKALYKKWLALSYN